MRCHVSLYLATICEVKVEPDGAIVEIDASTFRDVATGGLPDGLTEAQKYGVMNALRDMMCKLVLARLKREEQDKPPPTEPVN